MKTIPVTHCFNWDECSTRLRPLLMREFAANGAKHLVLTDSLLRGIMQSFEFGKSLLRDAEEAGVEFCDAHAPFRASENLNSPRPDERPMMIECLKLVLKIVRDFGVKTCTIHVGDVPFREYSLEYYDSCAIHSLEELLPTAEACGVIIAIENSWFPTNTPEKLLSILDHFRSPFLGICYDSGHANLMAKGMNFAESYVRDGWAGWADKIPWDDQILEKLLPHVVSCHLHDNRGQYDNHDLPGGGNIDWARMMSTLANAPELRCIQNEVDSIGHQIPIATLCRTFDRLAAKMEGRSGSPSPF